MTVLYGALFALSFLVTADLLPWIIRLARRSGFLDFPGPRKVHAEPVPYGGGIAVAAGVLVAAGVAGLAASGAFPALPEAVASELRAAAPRSPTVLVYALGSLVILALGLVDDRRNLAAGFKLGVQAVVALGVALGGERLALFDRGEAVEVAVTVIWILGVTNAFNLLDHMDGLSGGVAAIAGLAFLVVALQTGQTLLALLLVPLLGACAGFLLFNFPPAKVFLGDAGSLFIGFWLSCLTISFTFYDERADVPLYAYFVPLAILAVPLFDTAAVVLIRLWARRPLFEGDRNHLAHRLVALGMSPRSAVLTVYALTLYAGLSAVLLYQVDLAGAAIILVQLLITFGIMTLLEVAGRSHGEPP
jgi:UDP-GlcNAc:undecaprenyl-phosphate GlcNAc-1-phosphate transferase